MISMILKLFNRKKTVRFHERERLETLMGAGLENWEQFMTEGMHEEAKSQLEGNRWLLDYYIELRRLNVI